MPLLCIVITLLYIALGADALLCYNGTFSHRSYGEDALSRTGIFQPTRRAMARVRCALTISCEGNAMCFVRSWRARAKHAWIVQRGCYRADKGDSIPQTVNVPTRSMTCTHQRFSDAEYKVCLCQSDWCNAASFPTRPHIILYPLYSTLGVMAHIFNSYTYFINFC